MYKSLNTVVVGWKEIYQTSKKGKKKRKSWRGEKGKKEERGRVGAS